MDRNDRSGQKISFIRRTLAELNQQNSYLVAFLFEMMKNKKAT